MTDGTTAGGTRAISPNVLPPTYDRRGSSDAGTFALVIGVSRYPYLKDGDKPAGDTYGLGQLEVSALTAYRFYEWLQKEYDYDPSLAKCWMLLSPTDLESIEEPELTSFPDATMDNCVKAIFAWREAARSLSSALARRSRMVFFFSGHGVERIHGQQVLLPSNYLEPPAENPNDAISTANLVNGLRGLTLGECFFFIDACRSNPPEMADVRLEGRLLLKETAVTRVAAEQHSPILRAVNSGDRTWQPSGPPNLSWFGDALIAGLNRPSTGSWPTTCSKHSRRHVELFELSGFVHDRMSTLLSLYGETAPKPVQLDNGAPQICLTTPHQHLSGRRGGPAMDGRIPASIDGRSGPAIDGRVPASNYGVSLPALLTPDSLMKPPSRLSKKKLVGWLLDAMGSECWSSAFSQAKAISLDTSGEPASVEFLGVRTYEMKAKGRAQVIEVDIRLSATGPHWLEMEVDQPARSGRSKANRVGIVLPGDAQARPHFTIVLFRGRQGDRTTLVATLAVTGTEILDAAAILWKEYERLRMTEVLPMLDSILGLDRGFESPLTATVAGLVLVKTGRWESKLEERLHAAAKTMPSLTDAAVLLIERRRRIEQHITYPIELIDELLQFERRPLPSTTQGLALFAEQVREPLCSEDNQIPKEQRERLKRLRDRVEVALSLARATGLFSVFVGPPDKVGRHLMLPGETPDRPLPFKCGA